MGDSNWQLISELLNDPGPEVAKAMAKAVTRVDDPQLQTAILDRLQSVENPDCRDAVCAIWAGTRHTGLEAMLVQAGWIASAPSSIMLLSALKLDRLDMVTGIGAEMVAELLHACRDSDDTISGRARAALEHLSQIEAQEELCRLVIEEGDDLARQVAVAAGYAPGDPHQRVLFYLLTEQWDSYQALDFDGTLVRTLYEFGDERLRSRIAGFARQSGRLEFVDVVAGGRLRRRLAEMSEEEWKVVVMLLSSYQQWQEMWHLAQVAPADWSVLLVQRIVGSGWRPEREDELAGFARLAELAERCEGRLPALERLICSRKVLTAHNGPIKSLLTIPGFADKHTGTQLLVSGSKDQTICLWALPKGELVKTLAAHGGEVDCLTIRPAGAELDRVEPLLISGGYDRKVRLWNLPGGEEAATLAGHNAPVKCLGVSRDGRFLVSGGWDNSVRVWRLPEGDLLNTLEGSCPVAVSNAPLHDDGYDGGHIGYGGLLITSSKDYALRLRRLPDGEMLNSLEGHSSLVSCLAVSPDGWLLVSGSDDKTVRLWSLPDGKLLRTLEGHRKGIECLAISANGRILVSGGGYGDNDIRVWSLPDGRLLQTLKGHSNRINCLAISPAPLDGSRDMWLLASGSDDDVVRFWSLPDGRPLKTLEGHSSWVSSLAFGRDMLVSGSDDGTVRLWCLSPLRLRHLPLSQSSLEDIMWVQEALEQEQLVERERRWLEYLLALMRWRRRADIGVEEMPHCIEIGEFDIEIDG